MDFSLKKLGTFWNVTRSIEICLPFEIWWKYFLWVKDDPQKILNILIKYWLNWSVFSKNGQNLRKFS